MGAGLQGLRKYTWNTDVKINYLGQHITTNSAEKYKDYKRIP
jgi:hypothetical protein